MSAAQDGESGEGRFKNASSTGVNGRIGLAVIHDQLGSDGIDHERAVRWPALQVKWNQDGGFPLVGLLAGPEIGRSVRRRKLELLGRGGRQGGLEDRLRPQV